MQAVLPPGFHPLLDELAAHQSRAWFHENRERLRETCERPMLAVLQAVADALEARSTPLDLDSPKLFRLARDVRFSPDKRPYKEHIAGTIPLASSGKEGALEAPAALYLQVGVQTSMAGGGIYHFSPDLLTAWRSRLQEEPAASAFVETVRDLQTKGFQIAGPPPLKRAPKGVDPDHPHIDLLRLKGLAVMFPAWPDGLEHDAGWVDWIVEHVEAVTPVVEWLGACVGEG